MIVDNLKKSILQQAILGLLSSHNSGDIDINDYLNILRNNEYIKLKDINNKFEMNLNIPEHWKMVKLGSIAGIYGGKRIPAGRKLSNVDTGHKYIRVTDMNDVTVDIENILYVPEDIFPLIKNYTISKDDLYITVAGTIGKVGFIPNELDGANLTENANKIVFKNIDKRWLYYCLISPFVKKQIDGFTTKVGQPKLAIRRITNIEIPLPPIEEQHRIVTKIDDLFSRLDDIKPIETELSKIKKSFVMDFKKSILEYSMSGNLLVNSKDSNWKNDDIYQPLWKVTAWDKRFKEVEKNHQLKIVKYNYLLASDMIPLKKDFGNVFLLSTGNYQGWTTEEAAGKYLANGEIVAIPWGGSPSVKYYKGKFVTSDNRIATSIDSNILLNKYLYYFMLSKLPYLDKIYRGTSLRHPSMKAVLNMLIPLPTISEQQEIVDKIEKLLILCDDLENLVND